MDCGVKKDWVGMGWNGFRQTPADRQLCLDYDGHKLYQNDNH
jgi:hypothetical protein